MVVCQGLERRRPACELRFFVHSPYRQLHMLWRLQGLWQYLRGEDEWKPLKRQGLAFRTGAIACGKMIT